MSIHNKANCYMISIVTMVTNIQSHQWPSHLFFMIKSIDVCKAASKITCTHSLPFQLASVLKCVMKIKMIEITVLFTLFHRFKFSYKLTEQSKQHKWQGWGNVCSVFDKTCESNNIQRWHIDLWRKIDIGASSILVLDHRHIWGLFPLQCAPKQ